MRDPFDLSGEVVMVTGASSGFGERFATVVMEHGASVALVARRAEILTEIADNLHPAYARPSEGGARAYGFDVTDERGIVGLFDSIERDLGMVTVLINNAGIGHSDRAVDMPSNRWDEVMGVDLRAPFQLSQEMAKRLLKAKRGGSIINIASIFGQIGSKGLVAYGTAKAGLIHMTKAMALELAPNGIRVNAICPGWCVTDMTRAYLESPRGATIAQDIPVGRFGEPADLDGAMLLLASDAGRYISGASIAIDGGLSVSMRDGKKAEKQNQAQVV